MCHTSHADQKRQLYLIGSIPINYVTGTILFFLLNSKSALPVLMFLEV